jgi:hypothetical protein
MTNTENPTCQFAVEMQAEDGYRFWSGGMNESSIDHYIDGLVAVDYILSDVDHTGPGCYGTCSQPLHPAL